jgi:ribokinase
MAKKKLIAGLGQCSLDYLTLASGYAQEDQKAEVLEHAIQGGGPVATALVTLARLGPSQIATRFMGVVSDDFAGREIKKGLKAEDVDLRLLKTRKGGTSQTANIIVNSQNGTRTIYWRRPTVAEITRQEVSETLIKDASLLMLDGLMEEASLKAALLARLASIPVLLDAGSLRDSTIELAHLANYIVCSEKFSKEFGGTPAKTLKKLSKLHPIAATVTLGKRGSVTWTKERTFKTQAFKVKTIDTTGAGDVFHGAYAYGIIKKYSIEKTVQFASAAAAIKCTKLGGRTGIPSTREILKLITTS